MTGGSVYIFMERSGMHTHHRTALRVALQIERVRAQRAGPKPRLTHWPGAEWDHCRRLFLLLDIAHRRSWSAAAKRMTERLEREVRTLRLRLDQLTASADSAIENRPLPDLRTIHAEVMAVFDEFEHVTCDLRARTISVTTEPIVLEEVELGRFEIRLRYTRDDPAVAYDVIALDPNPAAADSTVTHPHVQDEGLCEGEARTTLRSALAECRLSDFFLIVQQTLQTYNSGSPYVSLDEWHGEPCRDCGGITGPDESACCGCCSRLLCGDCQFCCTSCLEACCDECTGRCEGCGEFLCRDCRKDCPGCDDGFCGACLEPGDQCETCHAADAAKEDADEADNAAAESEQTQEVAATTGPGGARSDAAVHAACVGEAAVPA